MGTLDDATRAAIEDAVDKCGGSKRAAASLLGISYRTILRKIQAWSASDQRDKKMAKSDNLASRKNQEIE